MIELDDGLECACLRACIAAIAAALLLLSAGSALAESGQADYRHYCASCHGLDGKGKEDGTARPFPT